MPLPLMGFRPFEAFPSHRTLPASSPGDTFSAFPPAAPKNYQLRPQGFISSVSPYLSREYCISSQADAPLSFFASAAFCETRLELPLSSSSTHGVSFVPLLARTRHPPSASSTQTTRHLPLSWTPAVLALLAFPAPPYLSPACCQTIEPPCPLQF